MARNAARAGGRGGEASRNSANLARGTPQTHRRDKGMTQAGSTGRHGSADPRAMMTVQGGSTLLTYAMMTDPLPLQASPSSGAPSLGTLTFIVSCPREVGTAMVGQIGIVLPVGRPNAPDPTEL